MACSDAEGVFLRIPALAPYAPIVRVGAVSMAIRSGMGFVELDDLRLAVDQAMNLLLSESDAAENTSAAPRRAHADAGSFIDVMFRIVENCFEFEAARTDKSGWSAAAMRRFDDTACELVDELRVDPDCGAIWLGKAPADVR